VVNPYNDFVDGKSRGDDGAFRLIFETDLGNEPAVRARVADVVDKTMRSVADTVAGDTGLDRASAELLSVALTGAGQVAARWWLAGERPLPKDAAIHLIESLLWRGIASFPRVEDAAASE
jgi:hypothetical protein